MKQIVVKERDYQEVNQEIRSTKDTNIVLSQVFGQRYLGSSLKECELTIEGTAGECGYLLMKLLRKARAESISPFANNV